MLEGMSVASSRDFGAKCPEVPRAKPIQAINCFDFLILWKSYMYETGLNALTSRDESEDTPSQPSRPR